MIFTKLLDIVHLFFVLLPLSIFFINTIVLRPYIKWILLISTMIPLDWIFLDNKCILTSLNKKFGDYKDIDVKESAFTERYFRWLYEPIMNKIGYKWIEKDVDKMVHLHWIINIVTIWSYYFFYLLPVKCR